MNFVFAAAILLGISQTTFASAISKLATGTASGFYAAIGGSLAAQIAAVGDPTPSSVYWNSGGFAPQYLELELPCLCSIHNIFLQVAQLPVVGNTKHQLYAGPTSNPTQLIRTLEGSTTTQQWFHLNFSPPLTDIRFLRIVTVSSPSWVAWIKFLVF